MLVRDFIEVPAPLEAAVSALADPRLWQRALDVALEPAEQVVLARFGIQGIFGTPAQATEVRVGGIAHQPRGTIVDVQWQPAGEVDWVPVVQGDVTLSALGPRLTHIEFNACYCRPSAVSSSPADRVVQHRVVEYAVRLILQRLADGLDAVVTR